MSEIRISPRIEGLTIKNYRALKHLTLERLTPFSVFLGPNGSGKSTLLDVFAFLSECFQFGLRKAWNDRGRFKELRSRRSRGPIEITLKYREVPNSTVMTYHVAIDEVRNEPIVKREKLEWRLSSGGRPFIHLNFTEGSGSVIDDAEQAKTNQPIRVVEGLASPDLFAVNTLGQLANHPRVVLLRKFIMGWYLSNLSTSNMRFQAQSGIQERLSISGDNLANVVEYLQKHHSQRLKHIEETIQQRVPYFEGVHLEVMPDDRLLLQIKDAPFDRPITARFASDGTLKLLAYLTILYDSSPPPLVGIEEPENYLHYRLLPLLAEECRMAAENTQLMVTTHSPFFLHDTRPEELWMFYRSNGYTEAKRASKMPEIVKFYRQGMSLGYLWSRQFFNVGDPLQEIEANDA
jgi:predicted ATPase